MPYLNKVRKFLYNTWMLQVLHEELGFNQEKTKKLIQIYDRNGDGKLSYEEFIWFYWKIQEK